MPTGETLAVETQAPVPPPPPTPTATASSSPPSTRRRHRTFSSSSSSSSLSTVSSTASSPSPSPRGRGTTTTSVPFSWEHHPGIPKMRLPGGAGAGAASSAPTPLPLPLPPPLGVPETSRARHHQHARRRRACSKQLPADDAGDPFAAALAECTRERGGAGSDAGLMDALFPARATSVPTSRRWSIASAGGVVGLLDLYGCKSVMGVAEGAFVVRRPVKVVRAVPAGRAGLGRAGRR